jgi:transcriptional regulator with XRE-family HTH domain
MGTTQTNPGDLVAQVWGENTATVRRGLGLTQAQLAARIHLPQSSISNFENGMYRSFTPDLLLRLAVALGRPVDELYGWPAGISGIAARACPRSPSNPASSRSEPSTPTQGRSHDCRT